MLKVRDLVFRLGAEQSEPISFEANKGEIIGVVGSSGSGGAELLESLATPISNIQGQIQLSHLSALTDTEKYRQLIGYLPNPAWLEPHLTGVEHLELVSSSYGLPPQERIEDILKLADKLQCRDQLYTLLESAPANLRQKVALIAALISKPKALFLVEPWQHLDWNEQLLVNELINELTGDGTACLIASHNLSHLEHICDSYLLLNSGALLASGELKQLSRQFNIESKSLTKFWAEITK